MLSLLSSRSSATVRTSTLSSAVRITSAVSVHSTDDLSCCNRRSLSYIEISSKAVAVVCDGVIAACMHVLRTHTSLCSDVVSPLIWNWSSKNCTTTVTSSTHSPKQSLRSFVLRQDVHMSAAWRIVERSHDRPEKMKADPRPPPLQLRMKYFSHHHAVSLTTLLLKQLEKGNLEIHHKKSVRDVNLFTDMRNSKSSCTESSSFMKDSCGALRSCEITKACQEPFRIDDVVDPHWSVLDDILVIADSSLCLSVMSLMQGCVNEESFSLSFHLSWANACSACAVERMSRASLKCIFDTDCAY